MNKLKSLIWLFMLANATIVSAQTKNSDSLISQNIELNYQQAKTMLVKQNLSLLANYYNVSIAQADLLQAKQWSNPYFNWNQDLYSNEQNKYFNLNNQRLVQIDQTIHIAGRHVNTVKLAKITVEQAKMQLDDVLRGLILELSEQYYALHALQQKQTLYTETLKRFEELIRNAEEKLSVGVLSSNEVLRLKSEQIAVKAEANQNKNDILETLSQLRILLNLNENTNLKTISQNASTQTDALKIDELILAAIENRPDYILGKSNIDYSKQNLRLQKSIAIPEMTLSYQPHDRGSNYVRPYQGFNVEASIPLFDRNQGGIASAKAKVKQAENQQNQNENELRNQVQKAYLQLLNSKMGFQDFSNDFLQKIEEMNTNAVSNYKVY